MKDNIRYALYMSLIACSCAWNIKLPPVGVALFSEMISL